MERDLFYKNVTDTVPQTIQLPMPGQFVDFNT